jgi:hypothetical protein
MTSDLEIVRFAASLIREHGDQAGFVAARKSALLEQGDLQAQSEWSRVTEAVEAIQSQIRLKDLAHPAAVQSAAPRRSTFLAEHATGRPSGVSSERPVESKSP